MAANGILSPPSLLPAPTVPFIAKRKHAASTSSTSNGALPAQGHYTLQMVLEDMLAVLKSYDTQPSILAHALSASITRSSSGESDSKRTKLTPPTGPTNIASLIQDGAYESLQALEKDVESAVAEILASNGGDESTAGQDASEDTTLQANALAFSKILRTLVEREEARKAQLHRTADDALEDDGSPVPIKEEESQAPQSRTVLTLFGSTGNNPKQMFSSLQQPRRVAPAGATSSTIDTAVQITLPLREASLPNILATTEVYPLPDPDTKKEKVSTIGEVFHAPAHLPPISPPKIPRPSTAKSNTITFAPPELPKPSRKGSQSYTNQVITSGSWLGYAGVDMPKDQSSPTAKQKNRQRALSMGEAQQPPSEATLVAVQQAKEDALFRSAYSSFAPTRDDSSAIIPEETKNRIWWQKVGEKRYSDMFPIHPALLDAEEASDVEVNGITDEEDEFKDAVLNFVPIDPGLLLEFEEKSQEDKDTEEILREISELLETLASYQRIRNSSLTTNSRTPVVQNSSLASLAGSPSTPSTEEFDVYQILKSQLTLLVSSLPPYAVAKLDGDQLAELNISRTILFDTTEYKGVLEEDTLSKMAKMPALPAAPPATLARTSSGTHAHYPTNGNHYGARPTSSVHQSGARPVQTPQSHYPQQQSLHRSSSMLAQRSPPGPSHSYQPGGVSYAPTARNYSSNQSYSQQTPRANHGQTPSGQYSAQRSAQPSAYGGAAASQYHGPTPQAQPPNRYTAQPAQNGYFPRSQNVAPMYGTVQTPTARTASPLKATPAPIQSNLSSRSLWGAPVSGGQMRSTYYGPSQYGGTPQAHPPATAFNGLPTNAQQLMIDRQQAQVAPQSQARLQAHASFSSNSGTPQPPNRSYGGQANGASMST